MKELKDIRLVVKIKPSMAESIDAYVLENEDKYNDRSDFVRKLIIEELKKRRKNNEG